MREYNKKWKAISELDDYIESTLDRSNHTIIKDLNTLYEKLKALKQRLEPNLNQLKQAARAAYDLAQKWNSRTKLEQWVRTYRNAY
jgi:outer membrane murein-binding lipoprotein Lpp